MGKEYVKSKELRKTEGILNLFRLALNLALLISAYLLVRSGRVDFGYLGSAFIVSQVVVGNLVMLPFYMIFLPSPIRAHLLDQEAPSSAGEDTQGTKE